ncbi:MAG: F0F1 ATP synthase subunit A [Candidatus Acidiferrales bacterium]
MTKLLNQWLGKPVLALLTLLNIHPANRNDPIPNHIAFEIIVFAIAAIFFLWLRSRISVDRPGGTQQCMEALLTNSMGVGIRDLLDDNVGHDGEKYTAMIGSIGIFVLICNLLGLFPTFMSPTATVSVPLGCAVVVFLYYNWVGIVKHGLLGHGKHFLGPDMQMPPPISWIIALLMLLIETVSNLARLLSLTVRLWVNILVSEILYVLFLGLMLEMYLFLGHFGKFGYAGAIIPLVGPVPFILLHIFVAVLQAFVFTILPVIYVAGAVGDEH